MRVRPSPMTPPSKQPLSVFGGSNSESVITRLVCGCDWLNRRRCFLVGRPSTSFCLRLHWHRLSACLLVERTDDSTKEFLVINVTMVNTCSLGPRQQTQRPAAHHNHHLKPLKQSGCACKLMCGYYAYASSSFGTPHLLQIPARYFGTSVQ